ncbi:MAG: hypothetical protein A2151_08825 [Candidatus Muproteobacteria bacterium RBG_16_65_34]|uniref:NAD-dependent epimerase/dehydratase domain-containing protein n=1 Tax=Candidatus Muproteobacteria bacterium RBG_16_65_34 TaxID=1817760 RepID=A0A1F6TV14_9PROT|nr:MAG: hypothetical protein A2151_08825 [Candidatus Muproteobacteria bacterium RBG_16_65_34]
MKILVTGSASHLARALLPRLLNDSRIKRIVGVDLRDARFRHPHYHHKVLDVRSPDIAGLMKGTDAVVHLAFVVLQSDLGKKRLDRGWIRDSDVRGSQNVFAAAAQHGVPRLVHCSSAAVYDLAHWHKGAITESHPRAALPGFGYAEDKIAVENWLDELEQTHPQARLIRLRPHVIVGPRAQPFLNYLARSRFYPLLPDPQPLTQCVHEADVAQALHLALFAEASGAFNLAPADSLSVRDMRRVLHRRPLALSYGFMRGLLAFGWRFLGIGTDPAWMETLRYNLVLHTRRARKELGWTPQYDSVKDCLLALEPQRAARGRAIDPA